MHGAVLVTGGAGYIGSHVAWALIDAGRSVVLLDDLSTGRRNLVPPAAAFIEGSISDVALTGELIRAHDISAIIHLAGSSRIPESISDPLLYYRNNVAGSLSLLQAASAGGVRHFIFSSTAAVYSTGSTSPLTESAPTNPISPYGRSKLMVEQALADLGAVSGLNWLVLRYFNVAGADPHGRTGQSTPMATHLIKVACEVATGRREALEIFGDDYPTPDGTCVRDYIHVADIAQAHVLGLAYLERGGGLRTLNCGYGHGFSVKDVVSAIERSIEHRLPTRLAERRLGDAPYVVADSTALRTALPWTPRFATLDEIVASALEWERSGRSNV